MQVEEPLLKRSRMSETQTLPNLDAKALDRFSRQNAALGAETTAKLTKMGVLVYGLRGLGIETAKNLSLQGVGSLTIIDSNLVTIQDTGLNFFLHEEDIGKIRSEVILPHLQELNPICAMRNEPTLTDQLVISHTALVVTSPLPLSELVRLDGLCRDNSVSFFLAFSSGVSATVFVDHGPNHKVTDPNGERPVQKLITHVSQIAGTNESLIRYETPEGQLPIALTHGHFEVTDVQGINDINGKTLQIAHSYSDPVKTVRVEFTIPESQSYVIGGILTEKKLTTPHPMVSLAEKLKVPGDPFSDPPTLVLTDLLTFSETQQHVAFVSAFTFFERHGRFPRVWSEEDASSLISLARELLADKTIDLPDFEVDENFFKTYSKFSAVELQPVSAFLGGVLAQEVVKCTGKFTPIPGFLHFSARESLPDAGSVTEADCAPRGHRNDDLAAIYGWSFVEKLGNLKYFMVGCGALGCEFMKNFALNGVCCGPDGRLTVTDPDRIELSNLSRQFLFREHNVGQSKATAATAMASVMNKDIKVSCFEQFVGAKTEGTFSDDFWLGLDGVCNALDNMEARLYVDHQCVKYEKSLLESGTMGTSGNVDTVAPFKTQTYSEGGNAAEGGGVPMCTLRNFPHLTDHCIEWARDQFELLFAKLTKTAESYLRDPRAFEEDKLSKVETETGAAIFDIRALTSILRAAKNRTVGSCAQVAFDLFHLLFRDRILDLQATFPPDARLIEKGVDKGPFWGEKKRYPTAATFNVHDEAHRQFILSTTVLFASLIGIIPGRNPEEEVWVPQFRERQWLDEIIPNLTVPQYIQSPVGGVDIEGIPEISKDAKKELAERLLGELQEVVVGFGGSSYETIEFEKDDDQNFHIEFITATANCRCDNYSINRTDFQACKIIAGKIIAAIATTTAAVCGLVILELFKLALGKPTDAYMNRQIGLAVNTYTSFTQEPPKPFKTYVEVTIPEGLPPEAYDEKGQVKEEYKEKESRKSYPENHTVWSKLSCPGSLTLKQFADWLQDEHRLRLERWDFVYGTKTVKDDEGKPLVLNVTTPVFPPAVVLDHSHLPPLELSLAQATQQIMKNAACRSAFQKYIVLWKECKEKGVIPPTPSHVDAITESTTLNEILRHMSRLGESSLASGEIGSKYVTSLEGRRFWLIPSDQAPNCSDIETMNPIEHLAAIKIIL